ncbi:phage tail protein, partial [Vibrio vulnificus]|uniref:phage tail protein n=1 Tax=Vibrio vulnificus TaxID=672 RepID=UPI0039B6C1E7
YKQVVGDGPNNKEDSYPITYTGSRARVQEIMDFLDRHAGAKAFLWTTPMGQLGLFTCANPTPTPVGGGVFKLTATFARAFQP